MIKNNFIIMKDNGLAFSTSKTYVQSSKFKFYTKIKKIKRNFKKKLK